MKPFRKPGFFRTLDAEVKSVEKSEGKDKKTGFFVKDLLAGSLVEVETENHIYIFEIIDPQNRIADIMTSNPDPNLGLPGRGKIVGSTWGGSAIQIGWVGVGRFLELVVGHNTINLSMTKKITLKSGPGKTVVM